MRAYLSQNTDNRIIDALRQNGFEVKLLSSFSALAEPVSTHADMLLFAVGDKIFKHADYEAEGIESTVDINEAIGTRYPSDVLLNIALVGKDAFCNTKHASRTVLEYLENNGYFIHHVSQGYAHCSTCIVSDSAIITADSSIANAGIKAGIDTLKISEGHISLPPYDYGFIGGASGATADAVCFCGSLSCHPDGERIREFCEKHGKKTIELVDAPLSDVGGILFK